MKIGYLKRFPRVLLLVQGCDEKHIWFHGLNDVWPLDEFIEMDAHPCLYKRGTVTETEVLDIFRGKG